MANHSNILVWGIPWTEEPGGLHSPQVSKTPTQRSAHAHTPGSQSKIIASIKLQ